MTQQIAPKETVVALITKATGADDIVYSKETAEKLAKTKIKKVRKNGKS
jgi:predicted SpoU family rRNA methylase